MLPRAASQARQAAVKELIDVALDGPPGHVSLGGDVVVVQPVALEPEDLHLALDPGVGVMVAVVGEVPQVFCCEGERAHDGDSMLFPGRSPSRVYRLTRPPTICARPVRAEYSQ